MTHDPLGTEALASIGGEATGATFVRAVQAVAIARVFLVEIDAWKPGNDDPGDWIAPEASEPIGALPDGEETVEGLATFRFSDAGYISTPDDDPADTYYDGRARSPLVIDRSLPVAPEQARRVALQVGTVEIDNADAALDALVGEYSVDGRRVRVLLGEAGAALSGFGEIANLAAVRWEADRRQVRVTLRDRGYRLDVPLQGDLYAGTGGAEGGADLEGTPKPDSFGIVRNMTPVRLGADIWQVNRRAVESIDAVYDRGVALADGATDHADHAALAAASVASGEFETCLAEGLFRLGAEPDGAVTCDVHGDAAGGYVDTHGAIALRILQANAGLAGTEIDAGSFTSLALVEDGPCGWTSARGGGVRPQSASEALSEILGSIAAWFGANRFGVIRCGRLEAPSATSRALTLGPADIIELERIPAPPSLFPPVWRLRVGYQRNWTVQTGDLGAVDEARKQFLAQALRIATPAADSGIRTRYSQARDPEPQASLFDEAADAGALRDRLFALYSVERQLYRIRTKTPSLILDLGRTVRVADPRFGMETGRDLRVVGLREDAERQEVTITGWG